VTISDAWDAGLADTALSPASILRRSESTETLDRFDAPERGVFGFNGRDRRSRPFNLLRAQVLKLMRANDWKIIGVTSATPRVGKSFMASNLAASLSRIPDTRTLLFDLDLRRGSIAEKFDIPKGLGINSFLSGEIDSLDEVAYDIADTGLTIFPSFPTNDSSAELLAGGRLRTLVQAMRGLSSNVICICDLPPAFANDDTAIVLREIDAYMFIVEEGKTTAHQVRDAIELLNPSPCMGTILNRYQGGIGGDDYGFGYGTERYYDAYYS
jgi:Mrp family chromosome partitioning ATPase